MFSQLITPFTYAFGTIISVIFITMILTVKMDNDSQTYCDNAIHEFVDQSRATGYISPQAYLDMVNKMNNTGNLYDISIVHRSTKMTPYVDATGNEKKGEFVEVYDAYYKEEIVGELFPLNTSSYGTYPLKNGDYIKVSYALKEPTLAAKMMGMISTHTIKTIYGSYGGYVGSTEENGAF
ncbi:MAG: hypothetical protein UHN47_03875 [Lachnospiraceae bacterium]|nr:hypothetical protein [Lachnospiraceae bacterium]